MSTPADLKLLIADGVVPADSEVLSTHNNLVVASRSMDSVVRIGRISAIMARDDPGDIRYSHQLAWLAAEVAPVVRPTAPKPTYHGDFVLSFFPKLRPVDWSTQDPAAIVTSTAAFNRALPHVEQVVNLSDLEITDYVLERLKRARSQLAADMNGPQLDLTEAMLGYYRRHYPFAELREADPALVHGDLQTSNVLVDQRNNVQLIDLDSAKKGPRLYDLASWRVRSELGDPAPTEDAISLAPGMIPWNDETYRALAGWKLLSSMTHIVRYEAPQNVLRRIGSLGRCGVRLAAPGPWRQVAEAA